MTTEADAYEAAFPPKSWTPYGDILDAHTARVNERRVSDSPVSGTADERPCAHEMVGGVCGKPREFRSHFRGDPTYVFHPFKAAPVETVTGHITGQTVESTADERACAYVDDMSRMCLLPKSAHDGDTHLYISPVPTADERCATCDGYSPEARLACDRCKPVSPPLQEGGGRTAIDEAWRAYDGVQMQSAAGVPGSVWKQRVQPAREAVEEAIRAEARRLGPLCDEHGTGSGWRTGCMVCGLMEQHAALSQIEEVLTGEIVGMIDIGAGPETVVKLAREAQEERDKYRTALVEVRRYAARSGGAGSIRSGYGTIYKMADSALEANVRATQDDRED